MAYKNANKPPNSVIPAWRAGGIELTRARGYDKM